MLIANTEVYGRDGLCDVRIVDGRIAAIGPLTPVPDELAFDAAGGALLPGLHDHHVHLMSYAASLHSAPCGPPDVRNAEQLSVELCRRGESDAWLRGVGYHESVAGDLDRRWLDQHGPDRPIRVQHRSGRLWIVNSRGLAELAELDGNYQLSTDGRLYESDVQLRTLLSASLPPIAEASHNLARCGVTGLTDMTPHNDNATLAVFRGLRSTGTLLQHLRLAGRPSLDGDAGNGVTVGETKVHLHEANLPPFDELVRAVADSHDRRRPIAVHCVTETELVFTLAVVREAGALPGDRIEHASVTPPALLGQIQDLGLVVVTQPNFVAERGDAYLSEIPADEQKWLYRGRAFLDAGIPLAGGTDAPFGRPDPWAAMRAAVRRRTLDGRELGAEEALTPEQALAMFLGSPDTPARTRDLTVGIPADLCLLTQPWRKARLALDSNEVAATFIDGAPAWVRQSAERTW